MRISDFHDSGENGFGARRMGLVGLMGRTEEARAEGTGGRIGEGRGHGLPGMRGDGRVRGVAGRRTATRVRATSGVWGRQAERRRRCRGGKAGYWKVRAGESVWVTEEHNG